MAIVVAIVEDSPTEVTGQPQATVSQGQGTDGEHSPEPQMPTFVVNLLEDDGPHTPEGAMTPLASGFLTDAI